MLMHVCTRSQAHLACVLTYVETVGSTHVCVLQVHLAFMIGSLVFFAYVGSAVRSHIHLHPKRFP